MKFIWHKSDEGLPPMFININEEEDEYKEIGSRRKGKRIIIASRSSDDEDDENKEAKKDVEPGTSESETDEKDTTVSKHEPENKNDYISVVQTSVSGKEEVIKNTELKRLTDEAVEGKEEVSSKERYMRGEEINKMDELEPKGNPVSENKDLEDDVVPQPSTSLSLRMIHRKIVLEAFEDLTASERWMDHGNTKIRMIPITMKDLLRRFQDVELDRTTILYDPQGQQLTSFYPWMPWLKSVSTEDKIFLGFCFSNFLNLNFISQNFCRVQSDPLKMIKNSRHFRAYRYFEGAYIPRRLVNYLSFQPHVSENMIVEHHLSMNKSIQVPSLNPSTQINQQP